MSDDDDGRHHNRAAARGAAGNKGQPACALQIHRLGHSRPFVGIFYSQRKRQTIVWTIMKHFLLFIADTSPV